MNSYPGGKSGSGVYQTIINQMPKHSIYIEAFLGGGGIIRNKKPAKLANIAIDADASCIDGFLPEQSIPQMYLVNGDALAWLEDIDKNLEKILGISGIASNSKMANDVLIYCDPPYVFSTRKTQTRPIYKHEMSDSDHERLIKILLEMKCKVILSGYASEMYDGALKHWRRLTFNAMTRAGVAEEVLWCNFPDSWELHDYQFIGKDFRERERIKRKIKRWKNKLVNLDLAERAALMQAIQEVKMENNLVLSPDVARSADIANIDDAAGNIVDVGDVCRQISLNVAMRSGNVTFDDAAATSKVARLASIAIDADGSCR